MKVVGSVMADACGEGLLWLLREQLHDFALVDETGLGHERTAVGPFATTSHLPHGEVRKKGRLSFLVSPIIIVDAAKRPQVGFLEGLKLFDSALEQHLGLLLGKKSTNPMAHRDRPDGNLVDRVHPFEHDLRVLKGVEGNPESSLGVVPTRTRVAVHSDKSDFVVLFGQDVNRFTFDALSIRSHDQTPHSLHDVAHDVVSIAIPGKHISSFAHDIPDRADDKIFDLHRSSNERSDNLRR